MTKKGNVQGRGIYDKIDKMLIRIKNTDKEEIFVDFVAIVFIGVIIFLSIIPLIESVNYSPLKVAATEFILPKDYKISLNIPQASHLSREALTSASNNIRKIFGLEEDVKNPILFLVEAENSWSGKITFGNIAFDFKTVTVQSSLSRGEYLSTLFKCDFVQQINAGNAWANVYILENGGIIKYVSVTIQRGNGDVLDMFTYGELPPIEELNETLGTEATIARTNALDSTEKFALNATENTETALKKSKLSYSTLQDPFGNMSTQKVAIQRTDAMTTNPFPTNSGGNHSLSMRSWAFFGGIEQFYANAYAAFGSASWANAGIFTMLSSIKTNYNSDVILNASSPQPNNLQINTPLYTSLSIGPFKISYPIENAPKGEEVKWNKEATGDAAYYNKATVTLNTRGPDCADTYNQDWKNELMWSGTLDEAESFYIPPSSYNGFYSMVEFGSAYSGSDFTANFYSEYNYGVMVGNESIWDIYCITSKNTLLNVLLDK